ncbi:MAG: transposase [Gammaproteobacteria bacterium]|nr:transposase [Gammaproteobacteria bacterium]
MSKRKTYTKEFKLEAVRLMEQGDRSPAELSLNLGVKRALLYRWQSQLKTDGEGAFRGSGRKPLNEQDEIARLKRELADVTEERDILKKAAAYFAKDLT